MKDLVMVNDDIRRTSLDSSLRVTLRPFHTGSGTKRLLSCRINPLAGLRSLESRNLVQAKFSRISLGAASRASMPPRVKPPSLAWSMRPAFLQYCTSGKESKKIFDLGGKGKSRFNGGRMFCWFHLTSFWYSSKLSRVNVPLPCS